MSLRLSGSGAKGYTDVKSIRRFLISTNVSITAGTKETLVDLDLTGVLRQILVTYNGDDTTGSNTSEITLTLDGVVVLDGIAFNRIYDKFNGETIDSAGGGIVDVLKYDNAVKDYRFRIHMDSYVDSHLLFELENKDTTNAANSNSSIIYDEAK